MSHTPKIFHAPEMRGAAPRAQSVHGIAFAATAAAVIVSLLTATVLTRSPAAAEEHHAAVAPAATQAPAASPWTSVPQANTVFGGKDMPDQEPAPTF